MIDSSMTIVVTTLMGVKSSFLMVVMSLFLPSQAWSKRYAVENLWRQGRGYDLIYSLLKCPAQVTLRLSDGFTFTPAQTNDVAR